MKKIELLTSTVEGESELDYRKLLTACLNVPPEKGFDVTTMEIRLGINAKIKKAKKTLELEDAEYNAVVACVKEMKWAVMHDFIVKFHKDVINAK